MLVLAVILLTGYLYFSCMVNPGCSGEYGIIFIFLGFPWIQYFPISTSGVLMPVAISIMINILIISFFAELIHAGIAFFTRRKNASLHKQPNERE